MKNAPDTQSRTPASSRQSRPAYISAGQLRAGFLSVLAELQATHATLILCRYHKPAAILRGGTDDHGEPVIHFIPVQSQEGRRILRAARQSA
jgi:hypothetical protein